MAFELEAFRVYGFHGSELCALWLFCLKLTRVFPASGLQGLWLWGLRLLGFEVCAVCGFAVLGFCV